MTLLFLPLYTNNLNKKEVVEKFCLGIDKNKVLVFIMPHGCLRVTCPLNASCLHDTPTGMFNKHLKLRFPHSPQITSSQLFLEHEAPISLVVQAEVVSNSLLSLYPEAICQHFLLTLFLNISLNHWTSLHHCCHLLVQIPIISYLDDGTGFQIHLLVPL